jgi:hypothetical protein
VILPYAYEGEVMSERSISIIDSDREVIFQLTAETIQKISVDRWEAEDPLFVQVAIRYGNVEVSFTCTKFRIEKEKGTVIIQAYPPGRGSMGIGLFDSYGEFLPRKATLLLEKLLGAPVRIVKV